MGSRESGGEVEGRVRDIAHGGDAVVETARGIVMARGALPGERVRLRVGRRVSGVLRAELVGVLEASPDRIEPPCEVADRCGGCPLLALAGGAQAQFKRERLARMLAQQGVAISPEWIESPAPLGYRARARLSWQAHGRERGVGYKRAGSDRVLDVERCVVLGPALAAAHARLRETLAALLLGRGEIALGLGAAGRCVIELATEDAQPPELYVAAERLSKCEEVAGVSLRVGGPATRVAAATWGDPRQCSTGLDGLPLWAPAGAFSQANPAINARLAELVRTLAEPQGARVLELYAGHGNLSVALAADARELRAVEAQREAADACRENLRVRGFTHARVSCEDAAQGAQGRAAIDVVVLDPPRAGAREVLPALIARGPARIVYVSCDLASLRRDLGTLLAAGYRVDAACALDMFPQTAHLESVLRLRR